MNLPRLVRTLRHLKTRQLAAQGLVRLRGLYEDPSRVCHSLPEDRAQALLRAGLCGEDAPARWLSPDGTPAVVEEMRAGRFTFAGVTRDVAWPPSWDHSDANRLWRYHLHSHGFLFELGFEQARELVVDYLDRQGPAKGREGWEPYPLSLRLMAWLPVFFARWRDQTLADRRFAARLWLETRRMACWLEGHLERHLLANHLLENAIALSLVGAFFEGDEAAGWRARGYGLLEAELSEQILGDGGHFERSPMYQQRLLYALGLVVNSGDPELVRMCRGTCCRMAGWLQAMTHPDGGIALFNDAALGVYPRPEELLTWLGSMSVSPELACAHGEGWAALLPSGYFVARNDQGDALFMDAGEIGPTYQPGHAHADFLSIELSLGGRRFVVDGGNHDYGQTPERAWARSVEAHSTVFVDGEEPLELWDAFRVGRRGRPILVRHEERSGGVQLFGAGHTGYRHLRGRPTPHREVTWSREGIVHLRDMVLGEDERRCTSQLRIDGIWRVEVISAQRLRFTQEDGTEAWVLARSPVEVRDCRWFPRFGTQAPAHLLRQRTIAGRDPRPVEWILCRAAELTRAESMMACTATATAGVEA